MEEQAFLDFAIRFNLRSAQAKKATIIYAVVCYGQKQWKVNTGVRIYPTHWDSKKQVAMCGRGLTMLDNHNNAIANNKIKQILLASEEMKNYLCNNVAEIDNLYYVLKQYINPNMTTKQIKKNERNASLVMRGIVQNDTSVKESSKEQYYKIY